MFFSLCLKTGIRNVRMVISLSLPLVLARLTFLIFEGQFVNSFPSDNLKALFRHEFVWGNYSVFLKCLCNFTTPEYYVLCGFFFLNTFRKNNFFTPLDLFQKKQSVSSWESGYFRWLDVTPYCYTQVMCNGLKRWTIIKQIKHLALIPPICTYPLTCLLGIPYSVTIAVFSIR